MNERNHPATNKDDRLRLTRDQLSTIYKLAKQKGWKVEQLRDIAHEMFGKHPDSLTKREALALINYLGGPT
jgi:hypothetical protein